MGKYCCLSSPVPIYLANSHPSSAFLVREAGIGESVCQSFLYSSYGKTVTACTHTQTHMHTRNPLRETSQLEQNGKQNWPSIKEKEMKELCLVLTNAEYDCLIQDRCAVNQQMQSRTMPEAPVEVEGFSQGHTLERENEDSSFPSRPWKEPGRRSPDKVTGIRELRRGMTRMQALYQLSMATVRLHHHYPRTSACNSKHLCLVTNIRGSWAFLLVQVGVIWAYSCVCGQLMGPLGPSDLDDLSWVAQVCSTCSIRLACVCSCQLSWVPREETEACKASEVYT